MRWLFDIQYSTDGGKTFEPAESLFRDVSWKLNSDWGRVHPKNGQPSFWTTNQAYIGHNADRVRALLDVSPDAVDLDSDHFHHALTISESDSPGTYKYAGGGKSHNTADLAKGIRTNFVQTPSYWKSDSDPYCRSIVVVGENKEFQISLMSKEQYDRSYKQAEVSASFGKFVERMTDGRPSQSQASRLMSRRRLFHKCPASHHNT